MNAPLHGHSRHAYFFNDPQIQSAAYESANHNIHAAPGYGVVVEGRFDGRWQRIAINPDEIDELTRRLHQAKRYARKGGES